MALESVFEGVLRRDIDLFGTNIIIPVRHQSVHKDNIVVKLYNKGSNS